MSRQNGIIVGYVVRVLETVTGSERDIEIDGSHTEIFVTLLHPHYVYELRVVARTVSVGPYSPANVVQMHEDGKLYVIYTVWFDMTISYYSPKWVTSQFYCCFTELHKHSTQLGAPSN